MSTSNSQKKMIDNTAMIDDTAVPTNFCGCGPCCQTSGDTSGRDTVNTCDNCPVAFFGCCGLFNITTGQGKKCCDSLTGILRSIVTVAIIVFSLLTLMQFGVMMDESQFPGSEIALERWDANKPFKNGTVIDDLRDGYVLEYPRNAGLNTTNVSECSNFVRPEEVHLCQGTGNQTQVWSSGWISAYKCAKTVNVEDCPGWSGLISILGMITFYLFAANIALFLMSTWIGLNNGDLVSSMTYGDRFSCIPSKRRTGKNQQKACGWWCTCINYNKTRDNTSSRNIALVTIIWAAGGIYLAVQAAGSWVTMCDKIDTGLGRVIDVEFDLNNHIAAGTAWPACSSVECEQSFGSLFMWYALAVAVLLLPDIFMFYFPSVVSTSESDGTAIASAPVVEALYSDKSSNIKYV